MGLKSLLRNAKKDVQAIVDYSYDPAYLRWYFRHAKRLFRFKDIHKGEDCFIIGNGPSLNNMDLKELQAYHTFGLNKIYLIFDRVNLNLSYHVSVNPLVIEQSAKEFERLSCPSFLSYRAAFNLVAPLKHIFFIATGGTFTFRNEIMREINEGGTVTFVAMQIAFYMGFRKVFLIGVDHNFKTKGNPNDKQFLSGKDPNHFHPEYFSNKEWHLPDLESSELAYHLAKFHFNLDGRQIYDATLDGKLQIFPKMTYEEALKTCSRKL